MVVRKTFNFLSWSLFLISSFLLSVHTSLAIDNIGIWTQTTPLSEEIASHFSFVRKGKVYVIGGAYNAVLHNVKYSLIKDDGTLSPWEETLSLPTPVFWHAGSSYKNFVYILGGTTSSLNNTNSVILGKIEDSGEVSSWQILSSRPLPQSLSLGASSTTNARIYFAGGNTLPNYNASSANQNIYMSNINPVGTLGGWVIAGTLPDKMIGFGMMEIDGYLYIFGGRDTNTVNNGFSSSVKRALINPDGTIGSWENQPSLLRAMYRFGLTRVGDFLITVGGDTGYPLSSTINSVFYTRINPDGTIGQWQQSNSNLPRGNCCSPLVSWKNWIYLIGGHDAINYFDTVYYARLNFEEGPFDLPFNYPGRPSPSPEQFKSAFWQKLTAAFDHVLTLNLFSPFTGDTYRFRDCPRGTTGIQCYDSHNGTDFAGISNRAVYSVDEGRVVFTSPHNPNFCLPNRGGFGCVVIVEYLDDLFGLYAHLDRIYVNDGEAVNDEALIGRAGNTGCPLCGIHLHFGVMRPLGSGATISRIMTRNDWQELLYRIKPTSEIRETRFRPICTYRAPNGQRFSFQDPSGWKGEGPDPWSKSTSEGGCGTTSPYLWKYEIGSSPK